MSPPILLHLRSAREDADGGADVVSAASARGETAIGHIVTGQPSDLADASMSILVNPDKSDSLRYLPGDRIIVPAPD